MYLKIIFPSLLQQFRYLFNCLVTQIANQPITWQQLDAFRCGEEGLLKFKPSIRMGKKGDLSDFERGMVVGARWAGMSISKTANLLGFSPNHR